jgi:Na+-transporting methylmalonyl-CoA/oxaloacetate decarboxylase gamma subunit
MHRQTGKGASCPNRGITTSRRSATPSRSHAIEETSLQQAAITTAIGAGTAFALLTSLLIILLIMGFVAVRIQRRQADQSVKAELALAAADKLRNSRATAAVVAVSVLISGRESGENKGDEGAVS